MEKDFVSPEFSLFFLRTSKHDSVRETSEQEKTQTAE